MQCSGSINNRHRCCVAREPGVSTVHKMYGRRFELSEDGDDGDVKSLSEDVGLIDKLGSFRPLAASSTVGPAINYYT